MVHLRKLLPSYMSDSKLSQFFTALYITTFLIVLPIICFHLRHSIYNFRRKSVSAETERMIQENEHRLAKSRDIIKKYKTSVRSQSNSLLHPRDMAVGITVVTVSRNDKFEGGYQPRYLTQLVGRLLHLINISNPQLKYDIFVCNVDGNPSSYKEASSLTDLFTVFQKYNAEDENTFNIFEKEKLDYIFCIEETLKRRMSWSFMIEDDAYPHEDLFPVLEKVIDHSKPRTHDHKTSDVTFVKFYHPERLLGYISLELERLPELIAFSFVFGTILTMFCLKFIATQEKNNTRKMWILSVVYFCLIALAVGRVNLLEMRRWSSHTYQLTPTPFCCTQAMLFPSDGAEKIVRHLKETRCRRGYGKDSALEDIRRRENYKALMVQPNLFYHIGLYSTVRHGMINPYLLQ